MYDKMLQYVKDYLEKSGGEAVKVEKFPFRKRSEHFGKVSKSLWRNS